MSETFSRESGSIAAYEPGNISEFVYEITTLWDSVTPLPQTGVYLFCQPSRMGGVPEATVPRGTITTTKEFAAMKVADVYFGLDEMGPIIEVSDQDGNRENLSTDQLKERVGELNPEEPATLVFYGRLCLIEDLGDDAMTVWSLFVH